MYVCVRLSNWSDRAYIRHPAVCSEGHRETGADRGDGGGWVCVCIAKSNNGVAIAKSGKCASKSAELFER